MIALVCKLMRDIRWPLLVVMILLLAFECLWAKVTQRIVGQLTPFFIGLAQAQKLSPVAIEEQIFRGPGKIMQTLIGGEHIKLDNAMDTLSIGYVHPLIQTLLCIWAIGRASGAIAGELDRGTMELLLAQPIARSRVVLGHLAVDLLTIPLLCLSLWVGTCLGIWLVTPIQISPEDMKLFPFLGEVQLDPATLRLEPLAFLPGLLNVGALLFAISGYTMWMSAAGRFRGSVLGGAVLLTLVQFLINVLGQLWEPIAALRPFTVFYYYQPQQLVLGRHWSVDLGTAWKGGEPLLAVPILAVLLTVGCLGYLMALRTFCRRDLPAPL